MLAALCMQLAAACVAQLRLDHVYTMEDVSNGVIPVPPTFMENMRMGLYGMYIQGVLSITGIHAVKLSFLIFFLRLGRHVTEHFVLWCIAAFVSLASFAISIGLLESKCTLSSLEIVITQCTTKAAVDRQRTYMVAYCTIDAVSDILSMSHSFHSDTRSITSQDANKPVLCVPIAILWRVRLSLRKKLVLTAIFSLTLFTVAVTIIRGTIQTGRIATDGTQAQNIAWVWFWLSIEFVFGKLFPVISIPIPGRLKTDAQISIHRLLSRVLPDALRPQ